MKLIVHGLQEVNFELDDPEITIADKSNPSRTYVIQPQGGYIIITSNDQYGKFNVDMKTSIQLINVKVDLDYIEKYVLGKL